MSTRSGPGSSEEKAAILAEIPGLADAPDAALLQLAELWESVELDGGYVCREGEDADALFILAEGECDVIRKGPRGRRFQVARLTPGTLFGHVAPMTLSQRTASVKARGPARVLQMTARAAREVIRSGAPPVASPFRRALVIALARQLHAATSTTLKLARDAGRTETLVADAEPAGPDISEEAVSETLHVARGQL